jgi:hypothetical protein
LFCLLPNPMPKVPPLALFRYCNLSSAFFNLCGRIPKPYVFSLTRHHNKRVRAPCGFGFAPLIGVTLILEPVSILSSMSMVYQNSNQNFPDPVLFYFPKSVFSIKISPLPFNVKLSFKKNWKILPSFAFSFHVSFLLLPSWKRPAALPHYAS